MAGSKPQGACNYQGSEFGASYLDSVCVDGRLFDADKCDDDGNLYEPHEWFSCPACNHAQWLSEQRDGIEHLGDAAFLRGEPLKSNPFRRARMRYPRDRRRLARWWARGHRAARRLAERKTVMARA